MQFLAALLSGQQCCADKASRSGEMNTAQSRTTLDTLFKRLMQLAMEQDMSRMRSVAVKFYIPDEIQLSSIRLYPPVLGASARGGGRPRCEHQGQGDAAVDAHSGDQQPPSVAAPPAPAWRRFPWARR